MPENAITANVGRRDIIDVLSRYPVGEASPSLGRKLCALSRAGERNGGRP